MKFLKTVPFVGSPDPKMSLFEIHNNQTLGELRVDDIEEPESRNVR